MKLYLYEYKDNEIVFDRLVFGIDDTYFCYSSGEVYQFYPLPLSKFDNFTLLGEF
jgi:hypothetical protein